MVLLHEGLGSVAMWRDFPQRLCDAAGVHGLVYSRPGYGRSTPRAPDDHWGVDFMHRQAHEVLPALLHALHIDGAQRPLWLLGHSDGGSIALLHAARFAHQIAGVVVMAPHVSVEAQGGRQHRPGARELPAHRPQATPGALPRRPRLGVLGLERHLAARAVPRWNIEGEITGIACPLLALQGVDDEYGTLEQIHAIARRAAAHAAHRDARSAATRRTATSPSA